ncbi:MAG: type III ribulose-bisphosphate carboxylase [Candidatus Altiarchaeota archaeon]
MAYEGFVDRNYEPAEDDIIVLFYVEPPEGRTVEWSAVRIAGESSVGTWTDVSTETPRIKNELGPRIYDVDEKNGLARIAYPAGLFEYSNIPQIMSSVAGNIYGMKEIKNLRLLDLRIPKRMIEEHKGPAYGIEGVRKVLDVKERPLVGTIVKPKLGLNTEEHAKVAYDAWVGGCDIVKDDENLTSQDFNPFEERIVKTLEMRDKAEKETGERKVYMPNITAETDEMIRRAEYVKEHGGEYVMVDVITVGFSGLQSLRKNSHDLVLHAHRAMHAALTRNKKHGITMLALAKLYRLIGMDQLHIGTAVGKMEGAAKEVVKIKEEITEKTVDESEFSLEQDWFSIKPTFPVCSGGLHPGHVPELIRLFGKDIIIQAGGGVHGHPDGTIAGAKAMRQAVDAAMSGITLEEHSKRNRELAAALKKFR